MAAVFIASIQYPEEFRPEQYDGYIEMILPIVERFGGKFRVQGGQMAHMTGDWKPDRVVVIEFPSKDKIHACFESPEYRWIEGLRDFFVQSSAIIVEE